MTPPVTTQDLLPSEVAFLATVQELGFGLLERLQIRSGQLILSPPPTVVRHVKFGPQAAAGKTSNGECGLRQQVAEFFAYVRAVESGEIRTLEIRHGLPFSMEVELGGARATAAEGGRRG